MSPTVTIKIVPDNSEEQDLKIPEGTTYESLLNILDINEETVIILKDGEAVPLDGTVVSSNLKILYIASGG
ncbi:MAG: MoaD/ThiS family protein [Chloroflexota bacterium]|nr:MoaD/ThiS family protein [Chloroflexota bacterium]